MREIAKRNISIEICPTSNLVLHVVKSIKEHVFKIFRQFGINMSISSDDPTFFGHNVDNHEFPEDEFLPTAVGTSVGSEWEKMQRLFGLSVKEMVEIYQAANASGFAEESLKMQCLAYSRLYLAFHELKTVLAPFKGNAIYPLLEAYENSPSEVNLQRFISQLDSYKEALDDKVFQLAQTLKTAHSHFAQAIVRHDADLQQRLHDFQQRIIAVKHENVERERLAAH